jgi:Thiamine biosynthesis enzyme ThiH and related uncharacterized enzymes
LRGLIEYGNVCEKNCLYCGLRTGNEKVARYCLSDAEVLDCARLAHELGYGSVALQSGERCDAEFVDKIEYLVREIKKIDGGSLGVTLSLGNRARRLTAAGLKPGPIDTCCALSPRTRNSITRFTPGMISTASADGLNAWKA